MESTKRIIQSKTEAFLNSAHLAKTLVGYGYLLDAAELVGQGAEIGPDLLGRIADRNGKTYIQVRRGLQKAAKVVLACEDRTESPAGDLVWQLLETIFSEKTNP